MDFKYLLTSFSGRIGRQQWWIGTIIMIVGAMVLSFLLLPILGMSIIPSIDPAGGPDTIVNLMWKASIGQLIMIAILAYPTTALMKKRLNDRNRPDWLVYVFWAPTVVSLLLGITGLGFTTTDMGGRMMPTPSAVSNIVGLASFAIGLWVLVELGILKGTPGPNQHGPDPVAA